MNPTPVSVFEPTSLGSSSSLRALWAYRDLLYQLTLRDVTLRYRQTAVGAAWAILQPLLIMLVLSAFASIVGVRPGRVPYPLFALSGLIPWTYFTHALHRTTMSLSMQSAIISKIDFPRLLIPLAAAIGGSVDFFFAALLLPFFMLYYGVPPTFALLALPLFVVMALAAALGIGIWLAVLNIRYNDIINALPFIMQLLFFATPIAYNAELVPERWRALAGINPLFGVIEGFRWALFGYSGANLHRSILISVVSIALLLASGIRFFLLREPRFVDEF